MAETRDVRRGNLGVLGVIRVPGVLGLQTNTGIPYMNIVYLVNLCTTAKKKE